MMINHQIFKQKKSNKKKGRKTYIKRKLYFCRKRKKKLKMYFEKNLRR